MTFLIGDAGTTWREWLKAHLGQRDLLVLDPMDVTAGFPATLRLVREDKVLAWAFFGSLNAQHAPHVLIASAARLAAQAQDAVVLLQDYRPTPLLRQTYVLLAQMLRPAEILVSEATDISLEGWPVGPHKLSAEEEFPALVVSAQRKAHWLKLFEDSTDQQIDLDKVQLEGCRLGFGHRVEPDVQHRIGLDGAIRVEAAGTGLLVVTNEAPEDHVVARALDVTHTKKVSIVRPEDYRNVLCSLARQSGEDFALGIVTEIDFERNTATIRCNAVPPAPARIMKLGMLRVDEKGNESPAAKGL